MPHTDAVANRFDHTAVVAHYLVERCRALLRATFLAMAKAWIARRDAYLLMEMSDHIRHRARQHPPRRRQST